jgi:hypothetical protein
LEINWVTISAAQLGYLLVGIAMPPADRVIVQQKQPADLLAAQAVFEKHQSVGASRQSMRHRAVAGQRDQNQTFLATQ